MRTVRLRAMEFVIYLVCGAFAGLLAGLFGVGGGLVIVPVLSSVFAWLALAPEHTMHLALGTSLTTIIVTASSSSYSHHRRGGIYWQAVLWLTPGIVTGAWLGAALADQFDSDDLRIGFGVAEFLLGMSVWPRRGRSKPPEAEFHAGAGLLGAGGVIGTVSALGGIGGGTLTVPYLVHRGLSITRAIGSSAACGLPIALCGSAAYVYWGWNEPGLPSLSIGYVYWPAALAIISVSSLFAPYGAKLAHQLPAKVLKRGFALLLMAMGVKMLVF